MLESTHYFLFILLFVGLLPRVALTANNTLQCARPNAEYISENGANIEPRLQKHEAALFLFLGFGGFSVILAVIYNLIRRYVYDDVNNVDSTFDAGGDVSATLTAVTFAAQLLWPADLMQSVTIAVKYGITGAFWYCGAAVVNMSLFPLLSFKFKSRAPGAKTMLQVIFARFGRPTHTLFILYSFILNLVVLAALLAGGIAVMQATIQDVSAEFCVLAIVTLCGSYSYIGGLGSTFYVSYFNASATFIVLSVLIIKIIYSGDQPFGSLDEIYDRVNCLSGVEGNRDGSRFTFLSEGATIFCAQGLFLTASITYCDQASWQSRIAAKPMQGAIGFIFGSFVWFTVPAAIGLTSGMTYLAEAAVNETMALSLEQIDSGIVSTYMAERALGTAGVVMMLTMIIMLTMSTGSGEIMAISAIIIYDIYQTYINPFRLCLTSNECILCGNTKTQSSGDRKRDSDTMCKCPSTTNCEECQIDIENQNKASMFPGNVVIFKCPHHAMFRTYQDSLLNRRNWSLLAVSIALIPFGIVLFEVGVDLNWLILTGGMMTVPSFPGIILSILWVKLTSKGLIIGSVVGFISGITACMLVAYFHYNGEGGFFLSTSAPYAGLGGSAVGGSVSLILTIIISLLTHEIKTEEDEREVWQKLRNIDNPLHPWREQFVDDYPELCDGTTSPTQEQIEKIGRAGNLCSIVGSIVLVVVFLLLVPGIMISLMVLSPGEFKTWTYVITGLLIASMVVIIVVTPAEEIYNIIKTFKKKSTKKQDSSSKDTRL